MITTSWTLPAALGIEQPSELVAFVGGGGKSSLLFTLAEALPGRVVITTTTRIFAAQMALAPAVCSAEDLHTLSQHLDTFGRCLVIGPVDGEKALGVDAGLPGRLLARADVDYVLVEANGSRMRPIKAPAEHEPVIPPETTLLVPVVGIDALDQPLDTVAHRPERVRRILADFPAHSELLTADDRLTPKGVAALLTHLQGGVKDRPAGSRTVPFINKVETAGQAQQAQQIARLTLALSAAIDRVVVGAARAPQPVHDVWRRVGGVVLAAGESRRMGHNKLLLPWGDSTVLEQTVAHTRASQLDRVLIVTGHDADNVRRLPALQLIPQVHNSAYALGMVSSVQEAVRQAPDAWAAILVVLGDQPMVGPEVMDDILQTYARGAAGLVVPRYAGRRGNPVLIDRRYFHELLALPPDSAPRALLERHPQDVAWVDVITDSILHDLDHPDDYARWRPDPL